jgi:hypothetical protein
MPFDAINIGAAPNDGTGETLRSGGEKINTNFGKAVEGAASSVDGRVAVFDGATGKLLKNGAKLEGDLVVGPASATSDTVALFDGTTGKVVKGGGKLNADLVVGPASATSDTVALFDGTTGKVVKGGGKANANLVEGPASATSGRVAVFDGTTGKLLQDGTKLEADLVTGPASSVNNRLALFSGTSGKVVQQAAFAVDDVARLSTAQTFTATLDVTASVRADKVLIPSGGGPETGMEGSLTSLSLKANNFVVMTLTSSQGGDRSVTTIGIARAGKFEPTGTDVTGNGMYSPTTNTVAFSTADVERMRISSTGNVGINTASPATTLHVNGTVTGGKFAPTANTVTGNGMYLPTTNTVAFSTAGVERMRISSTGNVGIGTTAPATPLHVNGTIRYTNRPAAGTITAIGFDANGDLKASSSSLRYKKDITDYGKGLVDVMKLRPVQFNFLDENNLNAGFIAEEVDALGFNEFMHYDESGKPEGVMYANMVALLTKAIQELKTELDAVRFELSSVKECNCE